MQVNFRLVNVNFTVTFMVIVNYRPLMGFDVNGRPTRGKRPR